MPRMPCNKMISNFVDVVECSECGGTANTEKLRVMKVTGDRVGTKKNRCNISEIVCKKKRNRLMD